MQLVDYDMSFSFAACMLGLGWETRGQARKVLDEVKPLTKAFWKPLQIEKPRKCYLLDISSIQFNFWSLNFKRTDWLTYVDMSWNVLNAYGNDNE